MTSGQLLVVIIKCVAPVLSLYGWWVSTCTCGAYSVRGPIVTTVRLVDIYLGAYSVCGPIVTCTTVRPVGTYLYLPCVWPQCYHCMTGGYLLVVLTLCVAPVLPLYDWWVSTCGTYPVCGPIVTAVTPVCGGGSNQTADPVYNGHIQLTLQIGQIHTHLCPGPRPASLGPLQSKISNVNHTPIQ